MKIAYIAHPIGGDVEGNIKKILDIIKKINLSEPEVVPFAPYIPDCLALDDNIPEQRLRGIKNDHELFRKTKISEVRLYGDRISSGMSDEINLANKLNIEIKPMTEATDLEFREKFPSIYKVYKEGDILVCGKMEELFEFGYFAKSGRAVVYKKGERNMQDSYSFDLVNVRKATEVDIAKGNWGW